MRMNYATKEDKQTDLTGGEVLSGFWIRLAFLNPHFILKILLKNPRKRMWIE